MMNNKHNLNPLFQQHRPHQAAAAVLTEHSGLLPKKGMALDLACGFGANALFLAQYGLQVQAWDISPIAIKTLLRNSREMKLNIIAKTCNITASVLPKEVFDVIVVSHFLDRTLCNAIMAALTHNGLLFYQTFTEDKLISEGPKRSEFLLKANELLNLFKPLKRVYYSEYARIGDLTQGERNKALFIGQKTTDPG